MTNFYKNAIYNMTDSNSIAISVKYLLEKYPKCHIYIITSDRDYLQLNAPNVDLYNLAYANIAQQKRFF